MIQNGGIGIFTVPLNTPHRRKLLHVKTPQDVLRQIKDDGIEFVDLKFADLHGKWQHLTVCTDMIEEESFTEGLAFDGSSIRGWKAINASDMAMIPDPASAWVDPFYRHKTLSMICSIGEPRSGEPYDRCPRSLAQRALDYLNSTGLADTAFFGPEPDSSCSRRSLQLQ